MQAVQSKKQPPAAPKQSRADSDSEPNQSTGGWFEHFKQLFLLLLKLKAWRFVVIIVPIAMVASNIFVLNIITKRLESVDPESEKKNRTINEHLVLYNGSDFAASKSKVLVDRSAFPAEAAAATSIMTAEGGNADWIEECEPESDCRERYLHRTDNAVVALIRYSKTPEKSRAVLECINADEIKADIRCAFLYKLVVLSTQKSLGVAAFKDIQVFELLYRPTEENNETEKYQPLESYDKKKTKSLPQSICADWIKKDAFTVMTSLSVPISISLAAIGVNFYLLISTLSCIRMLKTNGFLQQLFRSGLSVSAYWLVIWLITAVECLVFAGVYTASNAYICSGVFSASTMVRVFVFFSLFCLTLAAFMLLLELLLPPMLLVSILSIVMSVGLLVGNLITPPLKKKAPYLLYIFSPFFCGEYIQKLFNSEVERQFSPDKLQEEDVPERLSQILTWTVIGLLLFFLLLIYLDFIFSSGNGLCLSPPYPLMPGFWCQQGKKDQDEAAPGNSQAEKSESHIEPVMGLPPIVIVEDVTKAYRNCFFCCPDGPVVLKRLSCTIYRGQITALIGHNGAGKSTLIKVLTGEELPDEGSAHIGGCLVTNPLLRLALRGRISICPQFDALCDSLTVMECIRVTLVSRAVSDTSQVGRARGMLQRLGLGDKEDVLSCDLSGGQKRKVSTILALLGDPDVVFLDEPTSGLDPVSRRQLWQLLQEEKRARSIILCTQFMDEADILADRKIFLCGGKIVCAGSSMFLKRAFGCSFTVNVSLKSKSGAQSLLAKMKHVRVKSHDETELQLEVPALNSAILTEAVQVLEISAEVETFGLSQASLDDVFMRLSGMDSEDVIKAFRAGTLRLPQPSEIANLFLDTSEMEAISDPSLRNSNKMRTSVIVQFIALFTLNIKRQVRVRSNLLSRFLVPAALLAIMAACAALFKIEVKEQLSDPESSQMDIRIKPQRLRVEYYSREEIPTACVTDGDTNPLSMENCESLSLSDTTREKTRLPILIEKSPSQSMKDFMSQKSTRDKLYEKLRTNQWIIEKGSMTPCVIYHAFPWKKNVSKKDRSLSIGIFYGEHNFLSKVNIHRRALVTMLKFFGVDRPETTTALAAIKGASISRTSIDTGLQLVVFYFVFSLFPVSYLSDPIEDMSSRVRSYLVSTGMTHLAYWINTFAMHWLQYFICYAIAVGLIMISPIYRCAYLILAAFVPVFILGIVSNLLTIYTIAVLTKTKSSLVSTGCVPAAVILPTAVVLVRSTSANLKLLIWMVPPAAPLGLVYSCAHYYLLKLEYYQTNDGSELPGLVQSLWNNPGIFHSLLAMPVHIIVLGSIICAVEKSAAIREAVCHRGAQNKRPDKTDSDMEEGARKEAERVLASPRNPKNVLEVRQLQKIHSNGVHAVRGITFGAMAGEIFGLLGANGAGKSSSMSVIVGEEVATEGVCEVCVQDGAWVSGREGATVGAIGYCPQHNPLFDSITVAEHIRFYADIRGLDLIEAEWQTTRLIRSLGLVQHSDKQAGQLSGGNKRRLCLAIALLGDPALIVIDEASTGVDPENKRFIWGAIRRMTRKQRSVMVTTHSMEEVEALCTRVGIMNKGRMISVGTVQQLRSRHGDAYTLELLLVPLGESAIRQKKLFIRNAVSKQFKGAQSQEDLGLGLVMQFSVPKPAVRSLSDALKWLAASQGRLGVSYWALYQMSLDQVFVKLIKMYDRSAQKPAAKSTNIT